MWYCRSVEGRWRHPQVVSLRALVTAGCALAESELVLAHALCEGGGLAGGHTGQLVLGLELYPLLREPLLLRLRRGHDAESATVGGA